MHPFFCHPLCGCPRSPVGCSLGSSSFSLCFPGQEQPGPILLGQSFNFACALQKSPGQALSPNTEALWPPSIPCERLRACPRPGSVAAGPGSAPKAAKLGGTRAGLHPSGPIPNAAARVRTHPSASLHASPLLLPQADPLLSQRGWRGDPGRGGVEQNHPPSTHTHIPVALPFGVAAAGEFQLFQHLYLFWLQFLFRPRYKLKAASLLTSSKLHLLTSPPRAAGGKGGCSLPGPTLSPWRSATSHPARFSPPSPSPAQYGVPTKAPCKRSLSSLMDDVAVRRLEPGSRDVSARGLSQPPGWH